MPEARHVYDCLDLEGRVHRCAAASKDEAQRTAGKWFGIRAADVIAKYRYSIVDPHPVNPLLRESGRLRGLETQRKRRAKREAVSHA